MEKNTHSAFQRWTRSGILCAALTLATQAGAAPFTLTNGPGDGTLTVGVDGYGAFGSSVGIDSTNAEYDPVGSLTPDGTSYESGIFLSGPATVLTSGLIGSSGNLSNPTITGNSTHATSTFSVGSLDFTLDQRLFDSFDGGGNRVGTVLEQQYQITNTANVPNSFGITRYLDGDLAFDNTIADGGGRIEIAGNEILYETDAASGGAASTTFVGITGTGGIIPAAGRFEISPFSGLLSKINAGGSLNDTITNDNDGDGFIDVAYDVTMALNNQFQLAAFETTTYTTLTLFGNAVPPAPGSSEFLPLLPGNDDPPFVFEIEPPAANEIFWFDPVVATGYEYAIDTALYSNLFTGVEMPSLAAVPQVGQYELLLFNGTEWVLEAMLDPSELFNFAAPVDMFRIEGIDIGLALDPADPLAFPIGISFADTSLVAFSMTPLTTDTTPRMPVPGALPLFGLGWLCLAAARRRR